MEARPAGVESGVVDAWVAHARRSSAVIAFVTAGIVLLAQVSNVAITPLYGVFAPDHFDAFATVVNLWFAGLWWGLVAASCALAAALATSWAVTPPSGRGWLLLIAAGLILNWGWLLLTSLVDVWGIQGFDDVTTALMWRATVAAAVRTLIDVICILALVVGGACLRAAARPQERRGLPSR